MIVHKSRKIFDTIFQEGYKIFHKFVIRQIFSLFIYFLKQTLDKIIFYQIELKEIQARMSGFGEK